MKCKIGKSKYKFPNFSIIQSVLLERNQKYNMHASTIEIINLKAFVRLSDSNGIPNKCAFNHIDNTLNFWPCPDKRYIINILYYPPLKKF